MTETAAHSLAEVRSLVRRIRVAGRVSITFDLAIAELGREAQTLDRRPAFIPDVTLVILLRRRDSYV